MGRFALLFVSQQALANEEFEELEKKLDAPPVDASDQKPPPDELSPAPRSHGFLFESAVGATIPFGAFRQYVGAAPWVHAGVGFEPFRWLTILAEADLYFFETNDLIDSSRARGIPVYSAGPALRLTFEPVSRLGIFAQGSFGLATADVGKNSLAVVGFGSAEGLHPYFGGRLGVEYYPNNRHMTLAFLLDARDNTGFKSSLQSGLPLWISPALGFRFTF